MAKIILTVQIIFLASLILAFVAGLYEFELVGNGRFLGMDSLRVMLWAATIAVFTSPIMVSFVYPLKEDDRTSDEEAGQ